MSEIPTNVLDSMLADPDLLDSILSYHVVVGEALAADELAAAGAVETLNGSLTMPLDGDALVHQRRRSNGHLRRESSRPTPRST